MNNKNISNMENTDLFLRTFSWEKNRNLPLHLSFTTMVYTFELTSQFIIFIRIFTIFGSYAPTFFGLKFKIAFTSFQFQNFKRVLKRDIRCHYAQNKEFRGKCSTIERFFSKSHWSSLNRCLCAYVKSYILMHFEPLL